MLSVSTGCLGPERRCTRHRDEWYKVVNSPPCHLWAGLGPSYISVGQRWSLGGNLWSEVCRKPLVYSYTGIQDYLPRIKLLKSLVLLLTCLLQKTVCV